MSGTGVPALAGLYVASCLLLAGAGADKVRRPGDSAVALRAAGLPATPARVRVAAGLEVAVSVVALVAPGPLPALAVAGSYLAFTAFVVVALRRSLPLASCGCFGRPDSPPSWTHVAVDAVASVSALWWALRAGESVPATVHGMAWQALPLVGGAVVVAGLAAVVLTNPLVAARRQGSGERA